MSFKRHKLNIKDYPMSFIDYDETEKFINSSSPPFLVESKTKYKDFKKFVDEIEKINNNDLTKITTLENPEKFLKPVFNINENYQLIVSKKGIGFISIPKLFLDVECEKCKKMQNISNTSNCEKCKSSIDYLYFPSYKDSLLGNLKINNGKIIIFSPQNCVIECSNCSKIFITKKLKLEQNYKFKCLKCFFPLHLRVIKITYKQETQDFKIKINTPLPNNGNCKHYKKSFRYFRFKCCKLIFACDDCHDEKSDHKANDRADKMICGFCSKEQSVKDNCECGKNMKSGYTGFWNAGKGTRNKITMNKKDSKKYKK